MANLPMVLITEILSKLPVKSLSRFLCVSKPWESLIKHPHFIKLHLKHSLQNNTNQAIIIRDCYLYSLDFPALNEVTVIDHPLKSRRYATLLLGSCNGLLCLSNGDEEGIDGTILCNPVTRKHHELPVSPIEFPEYPNESAICEHLVYGFGYDRVNDDYKVVRITQFFGDGDEFDSEVKVYSLKSGSWKRISDFPREYYLTYGKACGFYVSGCLHWVVTRKPKSDGTKLIIAFDLATEEYKTVSQPKYYLDGKFHMNVEVLKGCLSVLCNYYGEKSELWIMEEYGVENSWTKLFSIAQGGIMGHFAYVRPIALSDDGSRLLVEQEGERLMWFDLERQTVENVEVRNVPRLLDTQMIVESLVPLECHQKKLKEMSTKKRKQSKLNKIKPNKGPKGLIVRQRRG